MCQRFDPSRPYNELPALPPPGELETREVLKAVIESRASLAELSTACLLIPEPMVITTTIPLLEAQASSEVENIITTNDEVFRAAWRVDQAPTPQTKEALRYTQALKVAVADLEDGPVSAKKAAAVCGVLLGQPVRVRDYPGTFIGNPDTGEHIYTPPEGKEQIERHLGAWERYIYYGAGELDPLILVALAHYQFEAIHPFPDGNGRTGRILNVALLQQLGLVPQPVLYLSGYIVRHKPEYYRRLRAVTERADWQGWILYMVEAIRESARSARTLIDAVLGVQKELERELAAHTVSKNPGKLAELMVINPYLRVGDVVAAGLAQRQTAAKWLNHAADVGLVRVIPVGREKVFANDALLAELTAG